MPGSKVFSFVLALQVSEILSGAHFHKFQQHQAGDLPFLLLSPQATPTEFHGELCWYPSVCGISGTSPPSSRLKEVWISAWEGPLSHVSLSYMSCLSSVICYSFTSQRSLYPLVGNIFIISFYVCLLNHVWLFVTPWMVACQAPLSMELSRQGDWSRLPFPSPGDLPGSGMELLSPALAGGFFTAEPPGEPTIT